MGSTSLLRLRAATPTIRSSWYSSLLGAPCTLILATTPPPVLLSANIPPLPTAFLLSSSVTQIPHTVLPLFLRRTRRRQHHKTIRYSCIITRHTPSTHVHNTTHTGSEGAHTYVAMIPMTVLMLMVSYSRFFFMLAASLLLNAAAAAATR